MLPKVALYRLISETVHQILTVQLIAREDSETTRRFSGNPKEPSKLRGRLGLTDSD